MSLGKRSEVVGEMQGREHRRLEFHFMGKLVCFYVSKGQGEKRYVRTDHTVS